MRSTRALWNSPVVLAYLLWEFASGYRDKAESSLPITWVFPALGILSQRQLCDAIPLRCATLAQYAGSSLDRTQRLGFLRNLGERIRINRNLYCESMILAFSYELINIDFATGTIAPVALSDMDKRIVKATNFRETVGRKARTLGRLFANEKDRPATVCRILGVYFK